MSEFHKHLLGRSHLITPDSICDCYENIPDSNEMYECCLPYASTACTVVSYSDLLQLIIFTAMFVGGFVHTYKWFVYQYTLITACLFQIFVLLHRTVYYGYYSDQGVSYDNYLYWKAMQGTVPIVMGGFFFHLCTLNSIQRSDKFTIEKELDTHEIRRNWYLVYIFAWIVPYCVVFGWAYNEAAVIKSTEMITLIPNIFNLAIAVGIVIIGMVLYYFNEDSPWNRMNSNG